MIKTAVILAGGKGTRLASLAADIPKPMVKIAGKPVLQHQIEWLADQGITEIWILVNHLKDHIISFFDNGSAFGVNIKYYEEPQPLGTTGGIKAIENLLPQDFLVVYGDVMARLDLQRLFDFHASRESEATLVVHPNDHPYDSDLLEVDENGRVTAFHPKPHNPGFQYHNLVNAAMYVFSKSFLRFVKPGVKADFGRDVFPAVYAHSRMYGYNTPEYLKDMGTPDRVEKVERDLLSGKIERRSLTHKQKAVFLDRDGVINHDLHLIHRPEDFHLFDFTAEALKKLNKSDYLGVVATNQSIIARNLTDLAGLDHIHKKMETDLGSKGAFVDAIYFCPHHPDAGYEGENKSYKINCDCRKPKPGMLLKAAERFNINLQESYMIGDSERDIIAGKTAGCITIGVKTGKGMRGAHTRPDYFFSNLKEAIDFVVDQPYAPLFHRLFTQFKSSPKKPFVIALGGNARSGKTTVVTYLKRQFEAAGQSVFRINLDDWILPKEERKEEKGVFSNFRFEKLQTDVIDILDGKPVVAQGYARHPEDVARPVHYQYSDEDIVLIDGVVALHLDALQQDAVKVFKKIDLEELKARFVAFYRWKGFSDSEIESLYNLREKQEYLIIAKDEGKADIVI